MGKKPLVKMPLSERAKLFMPFSALKGLDEVLRNEEEKQLMREKEYYDPEGFRDEVQ